MSELKGFFDMKTLVIVAALGGGAPIAQYLGYTAPAKAEVVSVTPLVMEAQSVASDALAEVAKLHKQLAECLARCGK